MLDPEQKARELLNFSRRFFHLRVIKVGMCPA